MCGKSNGQDHVASCRDKTCEPNEGVVWKQQQGQTWNDRVGSS